MFKRKCPVPFLDGRLDILQAVPTNNDWLVAQQDDSVHQNDNGGPGGI
jgi:hypothetical protein